MCIRKSQRLTRDYDSNQCVVARVWGICKYSQPLPDFVCFIQPLYGYVIFFVFGDLVVLTIDVLIRRNMLMPLLALHSSKMSSKMHSLLRRHTSASRSLIVTDAFLGPLRQSCSKLSKKGSMLECAHLRVFSLLSHIYTSLLFTNGCPLLSHCSQ